MANELEWDIVNYLDTWDSSAGGNGSIKAGDGADSAVRYRNITIAQGTSIYSAVFKFIVDAKGAGSGTARTLVYGINEDNTADFGGDPLGRPKTSASTTYNITPPAIGERVDCTVTSQVQAIINRAGWVSGNALGFIINNNSSDANVWIKDNFGAVPDTYLSILLSANPTFTPTPISTDSKPKSVKVSYGIKYSKPHKSVLNATEADIYFSSGKPTLKAKFFGMRTMTNETASLVVHQLGYNPIYTGYGKPSTLLYKLPKFSGSFFVSYIEADKSEARAYSTNVINIFYYIFIDDLNL